MASVGLRPTLRVSDMKQMQYIFISLLLMAFPLTSVAGWAIESNQSSITYLSSKLTGNLSTIFENNRFTNFSGTINDAGEVVLNIDMNSVDTGVAIRDERVKEHVFNVKQYPQATVKMSVKDLIVDCCEFGYTQMVEVLLSMRGVTKKIKGKVGVTRRDDRLLVQSVSPILINATDYGMLEGIQTIKELVKLVNIPTTIPVSFQLVFVKE